MRAQKQTRLIIAVAAVALLVLAALAPMPVAVVTESVALLPLFVARVAIAAPPDAQPQPVALLALTTLRAPPIA